MNRMFACAKLSLLVLVIIHLLYLGPLFKSGFYQSHDGENHLARFGAYAKAFSDGQFPPRWAGDLNYGYGSPVFIFFAPLAGYLGAAANLAGLSLENSFKLIAGLAFVAAPVFFFLWARLLTGPATAFFASLLYGLSPYHFLNLYVRGDIGEILALAFFPGLMFFLEKLKKSEAGRYFWGGSLFYGLIILSHNALALIFSAVALLYIITANWHDKKILKIQFSVIIAGLGLSAFFWLPALIEQKYTFADLFIDKMYRQHFPDFFQLIQSPWNFGPDVAKAGGLSPQLGLVAWVAVAMSIANLEKRGRKPLSILWLAFFFLGVFFSLPVSSVFWNNLTLLARFQFPWRFMALSSTAAAAVIIYMPLKKNLYYFYFIFILIILRNSTFFVKTYHEIRRPDQFYLNFPATTFFHGEGTTRWSEGDASEYPAAPVQIISGEALVNDYQRLSWKHEFTISAQNQTTVLDNTLYFPGWRVKAGGKKIPIEFQDINHRGLITFQVPSGVSKVEVYFGKSPVRLVSDLISAAAILSLGAMIIKKKRKQ